VCISYMYYIYVAVNTINASTDVHCSTDKAFLADPYRHNCQLIAIISFEYSNEMQNMIESI